MFERQSAIVFGAAKGIGRASAMEFARRGARVSVADINLAGAEETAAAIIEAGGTAKALACDVADLGSMQAARDAAAKAFGTPTIVMNNVGILVAGSPGDIPLSEWQRIIDVNLMSVARSLDVFLPDLLEGGRGHIVNVASAAALFPYAPSRLPYVASKSAIIGISESLAIHLKPKGIGVTCLCPGPVVTNIADNVKNWSPGAPMQGPGSHYSLKNPAEVGPLLADAMEQGQVMVVTHENLWADYRRHAANPDQFIAEKIAEFARGEIGSPAWPADNPA